MSRDRTEQDLRDWARLQVRAGLLDEEAVLREVRDAIAAELPDLDADVLARAWVARARQDLRVEQDTWPETTDVDRLRAAFVECGRHGVPVMPGVEDHWSVRDELRRRAGEGLRGIAWFTHPDVWHAIDEGMLEVNLWHATGANVAPGDDLLDQVVACLGRHGLEARFDEGRIEVACHWRRRA